MSFTPLSSDLIETFNTDTSIPGLSNRYLRSDGTWSGVTPIFGNVNQITNAESDTLSSTALPDNGNFILTNRNDSLFIHGINTSSLIFGPVTGSRVPFFTNIHYKNININQDSDKWYNSKTKKCYYSSDTLLFVDNENVIYAKGTNKYGILEKSAPGETTVQDVKPAMVPSGNSLSYIVIDPDKTNINSGKHASGFSLNDVIVKEQDNTLYGRWIVIHKDLNPSYASKYGRGTGAVTATSSPVVCSYTGLGTGYAENLWIEFATNTNNRQQTFHYTVGAPNQWYIHSLISNHNNSLAIVKKTDDSESELWIAGGNVQHVLGQGPGFTSDNDPLNDDVGSSIHIPILEWDWNPPVWDNTQWSFTAGQFTKVAHNLKNYDRLAVTTTLIGNQSIYYYAYVNADDTFRLYANPKKVQEAVLDPPAASASDITPAGDENIYYNTTRLNPKKVYTFSNGELAINGTGTGTNGESYLVLTNDNKLVSWGNNKQFQLHQDGINKNVPVPRVYDIDRVWVGPRSVFYTKTTGATGSLYCYGNKSDGLLGSYGAGSPGINSFDLTSTIDSNLNNNDWEITNVFILDTRFTQWEISDNNKPVVGAGVFIIYKSKTGARNRIYTAGHNLYSKLGLSKYLSTESNTANISATDLIADGGINGIKFEEVYFPEDPANIVQVNNGKDYTIISCKDSPTDRSSRIYFAGNASSFGLQPLINNAAAANNIIDQFTRFDHLIPTSDPTHCPN